MRHVLGSRLTPPVPAQELALRRLTPIDTEDTQTAMLMADMTTYLPEDLLTLLDRTSMAVSVEGRVPLLDHRLVEAALAVPAARRTPGGRQKGLMRELAEDFSAARRHPGAQARLCVARGRLGAKRSR